MTFSLQFKGFDYVAFFNGAYEDSNSLASLLLTNANSIEATLDYGIDVRTSQVVADSNYTDSLTALGNTIAEAERLGLSVMVRPLIDFLNPALIAPYSVGEWRQDYQPTNVAAFFASYKQMIVAEAQVAQQNGAQMLSVGAELDQLSGAQYLPYWTDIINSVRAVFSGKLTYSASWGTASQVSFWSQLDYEGVDCYVPLSNVQNPTLQDLVNGWLEAATQATNPGAYAVIGNQSPIQYFENLAAQSGKPLLFTELGYANDSGAAADPSASGNNPDPTLQAELYQAFFQAWTQSGSASLIGTYFWEWDPNGSLSNVGPGIDSFSPQNNPAQNEAAAGFKNVVVVPVPAEIFWFNASTQQVGEWIMSNNDPTWDLLSTSANGWNVVGNGNYHGAGNSDILWYNVQTEQLGDWANGDSSTWVLLSANTNGWTVVGSGDYNGDGTSDILWYNPQSQQLGDWIMSDNHPTWNLLTNNTNGWTVVGNGDYNGDGTSDILFYNASSQQLGDWTMSNNTPTWNLLSNNTNGWTVVGSGDYNGDGTDDILFYNAQTQQLGDWVMHNNTPTWNLLSNNTNGWTVVGSGDYNGDGTDDILFYNAQTQQLGDWVMHSNTPTWNMLSTNTNGWTVTGGTS